MSHAFSMKWICFCHEQSCKRDTYWGNVGCDLFCIFMSLARYIVFEQNFPNKDPPPLPRGTELKVVQLHLFYIDCDNFHRIGLLLANSRKSW